MCPNPPNVSQKQENEDAQNVSQKQENEDAQAADEDEAKKPESEVKFVAQLSNVTRWL